MLFILTGEAQIGKTRWLERQVASLTGQGVPVDGVLAPGVWRPRAAPDAPGALGCPPAGGIGIPQGRPGAAEAALSPFEKLGIDNLLLPQCTRVPFARRRDLAMAEGTFDPASQSAAAKLDWAISDEAIAQVNAHFEALAQRAGEAPSNGAGGLLVVDELGRLELMRNAGLTEAVKLVEGGAVPRYPHALVVVRALLLQVAQERFADAWGGACALSPDEAAAARLHAAFGLGARPAFQG